MGVELPGQIARLGNRPIMLAHQLAEYLPNDGFACAGFATNYQRYSRLSSRVLDNVGKEANDLVVVFLVSGRHVIHDMLQEQAALTFGVAADISLDSPSLPQIRAHSGVVESRGFPSVFG